MHENVAADAVPFRKAWLRAIVDRIVGDKASLEQAVAADGL